MTDKRLQDEIRQKALGAMLTDAFFTWPSAVTIGLTIIAFFSGIQLFPGMQPWVWLIIGAVLEVIYLVATLTDPSARQQAMSRILRERYDPSTIKNANARLKLQRALEYKKIIDEYVARQQGALKIELEGTSAEIDEWIGLIYRLAQSIDTFEANPIIDRDRRTVPTELRSLQSRLRIETDPGVRREIEEAIRIRENLMRDLKQVESLVKRTEIKMDSTVAQLSTVHAKLQLIDSRALDSGRTKRLQDEIHEEVASLQDIVDAMEDVHASGSYADALSTLSVEAGSEGGISDLSQAEDDAARRSAGGTRS